MTPKQRKKLLKHKNPRSYRKRILPNQLYPKTHFLPSAFLRLSEC